MPQKGDILVDNHYLFEVGGKNKNHKQIANIPNSYVIADNIDVGFENKIPLWLFVLIQNILQTPCAFREHHRRSMGLRWAFDVYIKTSLPLCKSAQESHNIKCRSDR